MADPIDTDAIRESSRCGIEPGWTIVLALCGEVDRLRAAITEWSESCDLCPPENEALVRLVPGLWESIMAEEDGDRGE